MIEDTAKQRIMNQSENNSDKFSFFHLKIVSVLIKFFVYYIILQFILQS